MNLPKVLCIGLVAGVFAAQVAGCNYSKSKPNASSGTESGAGSSPTPGSGAGTINPVNMQAPTETFKTGEVTALKTRDIDAIESYNCGVLDTAQSSSHAAFGCFIAKTARLSGSPSSASLRLTQSLLASLIDEGVTTANSFADLLTHIHQPVPNINHDILDAANPDALFTRLGVVLHTPAGPHFKYINYPNLPFGTTPRSLYKGAPLHYDSYGEIAAAEVLLGMRTVSTTGDTFVADFAQVETAIDQLDSLLVASLGDPSFSYVIPHDFFQGISDITIRPVDLKGFHAAAKAMKIFVHLFSAYHMGIDPNRVVAPITVSGRTLGQLDKPELVADMNGVGGDGVKFVELRSGAADQSALIPYLQEAVNNFIEMYDAVLGGAPSDVFRDRVLDGTLPNKSTAKMRKYAGYVQASLAHPGVLFAVDPAHPTRTLNVTGGLSNLPDPHTVSSADPFVLGSSGEVKPVVAFFHTLLAGIATW